MLILNQHRVCICSTKPVFSSYLELNKLEQKDASTLYRGQCKKKKSAISALFLDVLLSGQKYSFVLIYFIPHYQTLSDDNLFYSPWRCAPPLILLHGFWAPSIPEAVPKMECLNCVGTQTPLTNNLYLPALIFFMLANPLAQILPSCTRNIW